MDNEPRKASDIILSLEQKVDQLLKVNVALDHSIKILSNRLNMVVDAISAATNLPPTSDTDNMFIEMPDAPKTIPIRQEMAMTATQSPEGFRRTSRPETYAPQSKTETPTIVVPSAATASKASAPQPVMTAKTEVLAPPTGNKVAVSQRIVDKTGKAIFLADIEATNVETRQVEYKGRTNGVGKFSMPLSPGRYSISIKKRESATKQQLESTQNLTIDGSTNQIDLPPLIVK